MLLSSCQTSWMLRNPWGPRCTCTLSTSRRALAASSYWSHSRDTKLNSKKMNHSHRLSTVLLWSRSYLLSWIWPSTLCSSFPNIPHGLKCNTHLSPVLRKYMEEIHTSFNKHWSKVFQFCNILFVLYLWLTISTVPYCSIQSFPKIMLCTQHIGFVHVYASLCL